MYSRAGGLPSPLIFFFLPPEELPDPTATRVIAVNSSRMTNKELFGLWKAVAR